MNNEEKIKELTARIEKLEKAENKRIAKRKLKIVLKILKYLILLIIIIFIYNYINNKYIKPYKEKIDYVDDKITSIESFVDDKWQKIQKYNPFN